MTLAVTLSVEELQELVCKAVRDEIDRHLLTPPKEVLNLDECAAVLGRTTKTVMKLVREEGLPAHYISDREPRFIRSEVLKWLSKQGVPKELET